MSYYVLRRRQQLLITYMRFSPSFQSRRFLIFNLYYGLLYDVNWSTSLSNIVWLLLFFSGVPFGWDGCIYFTPVRFSPTRTFSKENICFSRILLLLLSLYLLAYRWRGNNVNVLAVDSPPTKYQNCLLHLLG